MDADLTFNTIVFKKSFDKEDGSERRSTTRGINTPDVLAIKRQDATQSKSKSPMKRYLARTDRYSQDTVTGVIYITSAYTVIEVTELATSTDVSTVLATHKAAVADANFLTNVLNSES